jgi:putative ABC transport system permease protein
VQRSLLGASDTIFRYWNYDVQIEFSRSYRIDQLNRESLRVPGVVAAESWAYRTTQRIHSDDTQSVEIFFFALPAATKMLQPIVLQGRWLVPEDENAVVVNTDLLKEEPDIKVGGDIVLKIGTRKTHWRVVGVVQYMLGGPIAYSNYPYASQALRTYGWADRVQIVTDRHEGSYTAQISRALDEHFRQLGLRVSSNQTIVVLRQQTDARFNVIIVFLLIMAVLLAVVGGLGLMGTMSINVLERTREIGVMRAIGASDRAVLQIVLVEGVVIGWLSWLVGTLLGFPLGLGLNSAVGRAFLNVVPAYRFSFASVVLWLGIVTALAAVASFLPAWNASRITVRDVLAYE